MTEANNYHNKLRSGIILATGTTDEHEQLDKPANQRR